MLGAFAKQKGRTGNSFNDSVVQVFRIEIYSIPSPADVQDNGISMLFLLLTFLPAIVI